jgi:uncharacterized membrane protein
MSARRRLRDNFFAGVAIVLPVVLSIFLAVWALEKITGGVLNLLGKYWPELKPGPGSALTPLDYIFVRVVILLVMIAATMFVGWLARNIIGRHLIKFGDMILERIPLFNRIYVVLRQISRAVLSEKSDMFLAVVLIEFPRPGIRSIGFLTSKTKGEIQDKTEGAVYTVFVPTSPNPTTGFMVVATEDEFQRLDMTVEEAMKMVISGGAVLPEVGKLTPRAAAPKKAVEPPPPSL